MDVRTRMNNQFNEINQLPQQAKLKAYSDLLRSLFGQARTEESISSITQFVSNIVQDLIGLLISKTVLSELVSLVDSELKAKDQSDFKRQLLESVLAQPDLCGRTVRFEEQISSLRESLATLLEEQEDWSEAAKALQGIPLDGTHRTVSDGYRLNTYIRIVRLLLEDDNATNAESYLNRASLLIPESKDEATILAFKLSQARILDSKRKFEEASKKYHEISFTANLDEEERESCLSAAVVCGVLAPAGPNRTRLLTNLFRDERSVNLLDYKILSKMVLGQIIRDHEMVEFEKRLKAHQLAKLPKMLEVSDDEEEDSATKMMITTERRRLKKGPENVFDRAVMQHNLLSVSRIYNRISFKGLGNLVGLTSTAVEIMARTMIQENRLKASIDQVDKLITFKNLSDASEDDVVVSNVAAAAISNENNSALNSSEKDQLIAIAPSLFVWDESIKKTLQKVETIYQHIIDLKT
ncbi:hypothetical protein PGT21_006891 [Puccinia graminis f. sp. tritici]|uniref:COP9 signalosome complex subunit 4 n=1 Tax=Puccinia graminis f. sp. tritici TaxID=56615 RepID=A0A5B0R4Z9_PUCGR|nr:hypothetical protein PGT21_006891 [Puccinia graminis f. sp. tritici]KAA1120479.1 hypothetical protein PGTUg99_003223 [Puccinia graminis f. sp. tritici]